jgi:hypothetical protein
MTEGLGAAFRRFPESRSAIESLASRDEEFRLLCADLEEAEAAVSRWEASSFPQRDQRIAEYRILVESLADELRNALLASEIALFDKGTGRLAR